jgi:hypothetical protein
LTRSHLLGADWADVELSEDGDGQSGDVRAGINLQSQAHTVRNRLASPLKGRLSVVADADKHINDSPVLGDGTSYEGHGATFLEKYLGFSMSVIS